MNSSMHILCVVLLSLVALSNSEGESLQFVIPIAKTLDNGKPVAPPQQVTLNADKTGVRVSFDITLPDGYKEIIETSVYFANDLKTIRKITFGDGVMLVSYFNKPWQYAGDKSQMEASVSPTHADNVVVPADWLPEGITRISASIYVKDNDDKKVFLNYYGIKNFAISLEDTYVVENYMQADFSSLSSVEPTW